FVPVRVCRDRGRWIGAQMRVSVDESRCHEAAGGVDDPRVRRRLQLRADGSDPPLAEQYVATLDDLTGGGHHRAAADQRGRRGEGLIGARIQVRGCTWGRSGCSRGPRPAAGGEPDQQANESGKAHVGVRSWRSSTQSSRRSPRENSPRRRYGDSYLRFLGQATVLRKSVKRQNEQPSPLCRRNRPLGRTSIRNAIEEKFRKSA